MASDFHRFVGRSVVLQLDDHTLTGTLVRESAGVLCLETATLLADQGVTDMDGEVIVDRSRVLWVQVA